jgi:cytochrome c oxidase subunit 2
VIPRGPLDPAVTDQADSADRVWDLFLGIGLGVLLLVAALMLWIIIRYRRRSDQLPRQKHYNIPMEVTYTVIPLLVVLALFAVTFVTVQAIEEPDSEPDVTVDVTAFQWQWEFHYPDSGVSVIGLGEEYPELVLPARSTVRFRLTSLDVIHSFWITAFRFKRDVIPGQPGEFVVDIGDDTGSYPNAGVCAEFCGLDHALMRFAVRILEPADFDAWLAEQQRAQGVPS